MVERQPGRPSVDEVLYSAERWNAGYAIGDERPVTRNGGWRFAHGYQPHKSKTMGRSDREKRMFDASVLRREMECVGIKPGETITAFVTECLKAVRKKP